MYKVLILDIDGTLNNSHHKISKKTYDRLLQFQEQGHILVLASGRPTASMLETAKYLKLDQFNSYIISFNGADITKVSDQQSIYRKSLDLSQQQAIIAYCQKNNLSVIAYDNNEIVIDHPRENTEVEPMLTNLPYRYQPSYFENVKEPQLKFIGTGLVEDIERCNAELNGFFGDLTYVTTSLPFFLEFMHREVSKGMAIERLADHLGVSLKQMVACGDGNNDASMIQAAGLGVAMGNATDYLKSFADEITLTNDQDGIIPIIEKYFQ